MHKGSPSRPRGALLYRSVSRKRHLAVAEFSQAHRVQSDWENDWPVQQEASCSNATDNGPDQGAAVGCSWHLARRRDAARAGDADRGARQRDPVLFNATPPNLLLLRKSSATVTRDSACDR